MSSAERIITGSDYVAALSARASDRRYRAHFQKVTLGLVPEGGALFDFGSGPGIDARYYAEHGRRVSAYDVDPLMCAHFAAHCADFIDRGRDHAAPGRLPAIPHERGRRPRIPRAARDLKFRAAQPHR